MIPSCRASGLERGGVYLMVNVVTHDSYVGCSYCLRERFISHISQMQKGKHPIQRVNDLAKTHGADSFRFLIVQGNIPMEEFHRRFNAERRWIKKIRPTLNRTDPRISTMVAVADVLGCKVDDLLKARKR